MDFGDSKEGEKISLAEPPTGMGPGFLSEYWGSREPLPVISGIEFVWYFIHRGFLTLVALPMSSIITLLSISVSLFLLAGFLLILVNVDVLLNEVGTSLSVTAYVKDGVEEDALKALLQELDKDQSIRSVKFISKADALAFFSTELGGQETFLAGLQAENPLPASIDVLLRPSAIAGVETVLERLRRNESIDEVVYGSEWVEKMQGVIRVFRVFGVASVAVALAVIVFLISNTIKLVIYARRDEIGIMQLVGASDSFVKLPFVLGGLFQGFLGSVLGLSILKLAFLGVSYEVSNSVVFGVTLPHLVFLQWWGVLGIVVLGMLVGALGSLFALSRFMNV